MMADIIADICAALRSRNHFQKVGRRADQARAMAKATAVPAAFVLPPDQTADPNPLINRVSQRVELVYPIVIALDNTADPDDDDNDEAPEAAEAAKYEISQALLGKTFGIDDPYRRQFLPMTYKGGYVLGYDYSLFWLVEEYATETHIRNIRG